MSDGTVSLTAGKVGHERELLPLYRGYRFPAEIVSHAVWLYYRFAPSFRDVEDLRAERGRYGPSRQLPRSSAANTLDASSSGRDGSPRPC